MKIASAIVVVCCLVFSAACSKDAGDGADPGKAPATGPAAEEVKAPPAAQIKAPSLDGLFAEYEKIRAQLAADSIDGLAANAEAVKEAAVAQQEAKRWTMEADKKS